MPVRLVLPGFGDRSAWLLLLFVVVGVLAPGAAVIWYMNAAARSEAEAARRSVAEAYRGQLRLLCGQVDEWWRTRAALLDQARDPAAALAAGMADAVILLDSGGAVTYPSAAPRPSRDVTLQLLAWLDVYTLESRGERSEAAATYAVLAKQERDVSLAARAAEGQIRCLLRDGRKDAAVAAITGYFTAGRLARALDGEGRSIAANELLLGVSLLGRGDRRRALFTERLTALLNDPATPMPSAQRLFLMDALRAQAPGVPVFASYAAERLAGEYVESERPRPGEPLLEAAGPRDLWKLTSPSRRAIALYRTATVIARVNALLEEHKPSKMLRAAVIAPGRPSREEAMAAGAMLPGWQVSWLPPDPATAEGSARRRLTAQLSTGYLVLAALAVTGIAAGQIFRTQWRLAQLKTDLVAAVSHEMKTPLASMRLLVETLLAEPLDETRTREYMHLMAGENRRLSRLIENFLTFSRIERNRQRFDFRACAPERIVETAVQTLRERMPEADCNLRVSVAADLPPIQADEDALVTVLLNLLENAYKYTGEQKRIGLLARRENGKVVFAVEDNGIGIAPREQKRIFRRFYQVDRRLARQGGGCGMGLSIVKYIVNAHGGEVRVESRPGVGSTFFVRLPYGGAHGEAAA